MTAEDTVVDILTRCWWKPENHPGEERPPFKGLDVEIFQAIRAAVAEEREACAKLADFMGTEDYAGAENNPADGGEIAAAIRVRGNQ